MTIKQGKWERVNWLLFHGQKNKLTDLQKVFTRTSHNDVVRYLIDAAHTKYVK